VDQSSDRFLMNERIYIYIYSMLFSIPPFITSYVKNKTHESRVDYVQESILIPHLTHLNFKIQYTINQSLINSHTFLFTPINYRVVDLFFIAHKYVISITKKVKGMGNKRHLYTHCLPFTPSPRKG
jgi:hypothetical protein